jgi:hypothetical protein
MKRILQKLVDWMTKTFDLKRDCLVVRSEPIIEKRSIPFVRVRSEKIYDELYYRMIKITPAQIEFDLTQELIRHIVKEKIIKIQEVQLAYPNEGKIRYELELKVADER